MKFLSQVLFSIGLIGFALTGCERHEFEDTKALHMEHGHHGESEHDEHAKSDDPAKAADEGKTPSVGKEEPAAPGN